MKVRHYALCLISALTAPASFADQLISDDLIVQQNLCIGLDCNNGEDFTGGVLKLKENNTRIRWYDSSVMPGELIRHRLENTFVYGVIGQSWRVEANQSINGGDNYFYFNQQSLEDYLVYSDGTAPDYDCSTPSSDPKPVIGVIPEGEPAEDEFNCETYRSFIQRDALATGGTASSGVAVGIGATIADGQVSLGSAELKRRLVHVANAIAESDVLIKEQLDLGLFQEQLTRLNEVESLVNMAEKELEVLEAAVKPKGGGGAAGWLMLLLPLAAFKLRNRKLNS
ncbi:hypothetical protein [Marinobacter apostichopi]|uniref:hypothetical protein n=1 Tax=Marinobacter apostichopi TaxID=3035454 RepID=UPI0025726F79|nr:hypothetical protein [Marinobacter sp. LA51]